MSRPFDYFVILAAMRTGSNLLEESLNQIEGLTCHGESFNPHFTGYPKLEEQFGLTMAEREAAPTELLERLKAAPGLNGFRLFPDHDPRVLDHVLGDPRCARIVLTRNPLESYVSLKIARSTGQWRLRDVRNRRAAPVAFDAAEFGEYLDELAGFQARILRRMQEAGLTAFHVDYTDLQETEVLAGLAAYLGLDGTDVVPSRKLVRQNPEPLEERVTNPQAMAEALARLDPLASAPVTALALRRGAGVPGFVAAPRSGLIHLGVKAGPAAKVGAWLAALDGEQPEALLSGFTRNTLRDWLRAHPAHRSFTVIRHPVARAHAAFRTHILEGGYGGIREVLRKTYKLPLPPVPKVAQMDADQHRTAFLGFARFLKANLAGQTSVRIDDAWAPQWAVLQGFAPVLMPDLIVREDRLEADLGALAKTLGLKPPVTAIPAEPALPFGLAEIYDIEIEAVMAETYAKDYELFGWQAWRAEG